MGYNWRVDETYVKVKGKWTYLYRAIDKKGDTIAFYLCSTRNTKAAKRFLGKAPKGDEIIGASADNQYRQIPNLWSCHCSIKGG